MSQLQNDKPTLWIAVGLCTALATSCSWFGSGDQPSSDRVTGPQLPSPVSTKPEGTQQPAPTAKPIQATPGGQPSPDQSQAPSAQRQTPSTDNKLVSQVQKQVEENVTIVKQDTGQTYLSNVLLLLQAERLVNGQFSPNLKDLADDVPAETEEFRLQITQADADKAVVVAIAKKTGLFSFTGAVYHVEGSLPISGMCRTKLPSQKPPGAPQLAGKDVVCAAGSTAVE